MNHRPLCLLGGLITASLLMGTSCEETTACTAIGCGPTRLTLETEDLAPGAYELELRYTLSGEQAFLCTFVVGDDGASAGEDAGAEAGQSTCAQTEGEGRAVHLYPSGNAPPVLEVYDAPDEVRLILRDGDRTLADDRFELVQIESYPNGDACGACKSANRTVKPLLD